MKSDLVRSIRLIAITDRQALGMGSLTNAVASALAGGLPALMLREKDLPEEEVAPLAREFRAMTSKAGALLIVNRRIGIARAVGADGVHLGIDGPTLAEARRELGPETILGYSAHDLNEALRAFDSGADYVIFSPIFATPSKDGILQPVGLEALAKLAQVAPGPVIALGGISPDNARSVAGAGAAGIAAIRAVFTGGSPAESTARLLEIWDRATEGVSSARVQPRGPAPG